MERNNISILTFENIVFLTNRDLLTLLKEIDNVTLLQACKNCDDLLICRITGQFSQTAKDYFFDDFARIGVSASNEDSRLARQKIGQILVQLYLKGRLKDWNAKYAA